MSLVLRLSPHLQENILTDNTQYGTKINLFHYLLQYTSEAYSRIVVDLLKHTQMDVVLQHCFQKEIYRGMQSSFLDRGLQSKLVKSVKWLNKKLVGCGVYDKEYR